MYETFYNLNKKPFSVVPDPEFLYLSPHHRRALGLLEYALRDQAGFCVVTGEVGSGKTTLVRSVLHRISGEITIGLVSNSKCESFEELLKWILFAYELDYRGLDKVELYETFLEFLLKEYRNNSPVALIVDEAQHLGTDFLEQLRMLSNVNTEKGQLLQIVLVGQPNLWKLLRRPELQQFAQRISLDYYLPPLEKKHIGDYVRHRLRGAGGDPELFEEAAYELIWDATRGVPRLINLLCDTALVYGYADGAKKIGRPLMEEVVKDKRKGLAPLASNNHGQEVVNRGGNGDKRPQGQDARAPTAIERWYGK